MRLFATPADEPRARRVVDVVVLVGGIALLALLTLAASPSPGFFRALVTFLQAFPDFLDGLWQVLIDLLSVWALVLLAVAAFRRRWSIARDLVIAGALAVALWLVAGRIDEGSWPAVWDALRAAGPPPWYPSPRIALPTAMVLTASPHLSRPTRRFGGWLVALAAVAATVLGTTSPIGAFAGLLIAGVAAAGVHLVFGSTGGRPSVSHVRLALAGLGVPTRALGAASRQQAGLFELDGELDDGTPLRVKVYGRDADDTALVSTLWRAVWYREAGRSIRLGRLQQVEHEAFLTLLAGESGVATDRVITAGPTVDDDAVLVLGRRRAATLADQPGYVDDPGALHAVWAMLARLHRAGIVHGQVDASHVVVGPDGIGLQDFRGAAVAPTDVQRRTDEAQLLVATVHLAGSGPALAGALAALGSDGLAAMLPYLQRSALTAGQRRASRADALDLDELRDQAAAVAGVEPPKLIQLRRITIGSLVRVALPAVAFLALTSALAGLDIDELADALRNATWWLLALGAVVSQLPRLSQAVSTLGAAPVPLPLGPVYALQLAVSYVNLAIPTAAARVAVNIRFFQRHGVPPGAALAAGALDGFGGFVVQMCLLLGLLFLTPASLDLELDPSTAGAAGRLVLIVVVAAIVALAVLFAVRKWREFVLGWVHRLGGEAIDAVRGLRSPRRIGLLLGGNLATELLFATALGTFTLALGYHVPLSELVLINVGASLLAGVIPIPGGIGVTEGALTFGLVAAGVPEEPAFAAVILYRIASFYLPPIWGFFALRWLERNQHL